MEKIQKAIAKARTAQGVQGTQRPASSTTTRAPAAVSAPPQADANPLNGLTPLQIDETHLFHNRIMTVTSGREAAPFDVMRTKIIQTMRANNWRRLGITSPSPSCGKSTLALNLAFSFARQPELRTFLGELDMHRPSFAGLLGTKVTSGFSSVLRGKVDFAQQARRWGDNLVVSQNTGNVRDSSELLQSSVTATSLNEIEAAYGFDIMIFDLPPLLTNDDVMAFSDKLDCVLLVAAAEATTVKEVDICERDLAAQTNVMGVVLNKCRYTDSTSYGGYYYGSEAAS